MKKHILFILAIFSIGLFGTIAQERVRKAGDEGGKKEQFLAKLELSETQQSKMESLRVAHHKEVLPLKNMLNEKRAALQTLTTSASLDQKSVDRTIDQIGELQTKLLKAKTNHKIAIRLMLDDKQKMIFDQMKHHQGRHDREKRGSRGK